MDTKVKMEKHYKTNRMNRLLASICNDLNNLEKYRVDDDGRCYYENEHVGDIDKHYHDNVLYFKPSKPVEYIHVNVDMNTPNQTNEVNVEEYLIKNGFILDTYYGTKKTYKKSITDYQNLYVNFYSDLNEINDVLYEDVPMTEFENGGSISFETINTLEQLKLLIEALKDK